MSSIDQTIVRAAIYPAIGVARVGNSPDSYFIGPEVLAPAQRPAAFYKDQRGALKRQAARFRVFGLNAQGQVVQELNASNASITWTAHVANKKAAWYEFDVALDIPQAKPVPLRNANFQGTDRQQLIIDPGPVSITGTNESGQQYAFDKGQFLGESVYLGELRTDEEGHLLFLGGHGVSNTPYPGNTPTTFANNNGWHDDTSDGPVDAVVTYQGQSLPVEGAWVVCGPPNYAPDIISVQTMYDVVADAISGYFNTPTTTRPSFQHDILPILDQFSQNQWVNQGFFVAYGHGQAYDFTQPALLHKLSTITTDADGNVTDDYREYRRQIFNYFRSPKSTQIEPQRWPWMYGDNMNVPASTPNAYFTLTKTLYGYLNSWVNGNFTPDWDPNYQPPQSLQDIGDPQQQADTLTKSALWYCLGGPFHPGCEMTWPMRQVGMYSGPFRVRRRPANYPEPDYGPVLSPDLLSDVFTTPPGIFWNGPGDLTRWMACPWQSDTASCRAGYESQYDPLVPTFWPARVPNTVLKQADYEVVMDTGRDRSERLDAFNRRASWYRILGPGYLDALVNMVDKFGDLGVIGHQPGLPDDPDFPPTMYVESPPFAPGEAPESGLLMADRVTTLRQNLADEATQIPDDQGLYVGRVGRAARQR
ncbi:hypothetical protein F5984_17925 [Rudanella paleaurantiibacter]|uniref:L-lysine 6-oxidase n=1 Tax=Rudanella paleaurantiibacter TaxID=2614655 RepID=A0A7J5TWD5_9BACT|nr:LodA/GoxA family CTQ-dependent oxidase [Rudanella paleaurantiibacter]KAB7728709.1 hypothetical protein F5984_17925 [Rudanella paleaurantiibacter]